MDLRTASRDIIEKELKPFLLQAIKSHPKPVDIKVVRGNIVTVRDYARRFLIRVRKEGLDKITAAEFNKIKPTIRIYLNSGGITFAGINQKRINSDHWNNYKLPFKVVKSEDARWTTLAVNPSEAEIKQLGLMLVGGVLPPIEMRTSFTPLQIKNIVGHPEIHCFVLGKNKIIWPQPKLQKS